MLLFLSFYGLRPFLSFRLGLKALMSDCPTGLLSCSLTVLQTDWSSV